MDCKSTPSERPFNKGELGTVDGRRSAKRKDLEDDGWFSACFSYNSNTRPTPEKSDARARVICCDFSDPKDEFAESIVTAWEQFHSRDE